jgi:rhamnose utilization protein RhaD (predicted bifunctional aldolase and dehydrogenase)
MSVRNDVIHFCQSLGRDPLLVQGAGGNVSWKENNTLWIKASGTWLAKANEKDIFVPVELGHLRTNFKAGNFGAEPKVTVSSALKPSIETALHALMPHRVVIHLHPVDAMAHLIQQDATDRLVRLLGQDIAWQIAPYKKPGADLARTIAETLHDRGALDVLFLKNHGLVIGGNSLRQAESILEYINKRLSIHVKSNIAGGYNQAKNNPRPVKLAGYKLSTIDLLHQLILDKELKDLIKAYWRICPDHVVFLGENAIIVQPEDLESFHTTYNSRIPIIFIEGYGAFERTDITRTEISQARFYLDVMSRIEHPSSLDVLSEEDTNELLNWEAENYRKKLNTINRTRPVAT